MNPFFSISFAIAKRLVCWQIREWYTRTC
jgi:hypothetical protein